MSKKERKPDFENESFRMWSTPKGVLSDSEKEDIKRGAIEIEIEPGKKLSLMGFSQAKDKETGKTVFAWKTKMDNGNGFILYWENPDMPEKGEEVQRIKEMLGHLLPLQSVHDTLKVIKSEKHIIENLGEKKKPNSAQQREKKKSHNLNHSRNNTQKEDKPKNHN